MATLSNGEGKQFDICALAYGAVLGSISLDCWAPLGACGVLTTAD